MENLFTINQVALILKVHQLTVRRYIKEQKIPAIKVGGGVRIKESSLQEFQKTYTLAKKEIHPEIAKTVNAFSTSDPFWKLKGLGAHLTMPENDSI